MTSYFVFWSATPDILSHLGVCDFIIKLYI
jgi:hypothetical protein